MAANSQLVAHSLFSGRPPPPRKLNFTLSKKTKRNETKRKETKGNETKRNETKEGFFAVRMALPNTFLKVFCRPNGPTEHIFECFFCRPHGPAEHIFEGFFGVRMALPNTFFNGF